MSLKTIQVCLTTETNAKELTQVAVLLARKHDAHLIGIHTIEALVVYPGISMHLDAPAFEEFNKRQMDSAAAIEKIFQHEVQNEDFPSEWRLVRAESSTAADRLVESARAADLVIMGQADREHDRFDQSHLQHRLIRDSGRPVLMIPRGFKCEELGRSMLVGWSATREATRAAHDALTLIDPGGKAHILRINAQNPDEMADHASNELAALYDRHGIDTSVIHRRADGFSIGEMLEHEAKACGADMIVTGAFGHSWAYDFVLGAVTRELLNGSQRPVMFSK